MKKAVWVVLFMLMASSISYAATTKETVKSTMRDWSQKASNFWSREGERSGIKQSTSSWNSFLDSANPKNFFKRQQDAYNARKAASYVK